jgi:hypothetical protein
LGIRVGCPSSSVSWTNSSREVIPSLFFPSLKILSDPMRIERQQGTESVHILACSSYVHRREPVDIAHAHVPGIGVVYGEDNGSNGGKI